MASKSQLQQWARHMGIDPDGMSTRDLESALDRAAAQRSVFPPECRTNAQKFAWAARNNFRAAMEALRGE